MKSCTGLLAESEKRAKAAFQKFDALSAAHRAQITPLDESLNHSVGDLILHATKFDQTTLKAAHAEIEAKFLSEIKDAVRLVDEAISIADEFEKTAQYLLGERNEPSQMDELNALAKQTKATALLGIGIDLEAIASDLRRNVKAAKEEALRTKAVWVPRTKSASLVATRTKRYLLSAAAKFPDALSQQMKMEGIRKLHAKKFEVSTRKPRS